MFGGGIIKTLKGRITLIYILLVIIITAIGFIAAFNIFKLGKAIDGLMTDNYKSINAVSYMSNDVDAEEKAILRYMQLQKNEAVNLFYNSNDDFYKYFNIESNNITEVGEKDLVDKTRADYLAFAESFSEFQDYQGSHSSNETVQYYNRIITPEVDKVKTDLKGITRINETAMFNGKNNAKLNSSKSMYMVILISVIAALTGLIISIFYTNKTLTPIYLLEETIKSVKEGDMNKQAPVVYDDEIGMLAREFNSMTTRLYEFEKSTKGTLLEEKNKSVTIVKSISDPLIVLDVNYRIMLLNNSCESFFCISENDMLNKHILEAIRNGELYEHIFNVINKKEMHGEKNLVIKKGDKTYHFTVTVTAVNNKDGNISGIIVLLKNITELMQLEKVKTDFIDTISHEFKTPLTSIMMGIGLIMDKNVGSLNDKQTNLLSAVKEDVQKLTDLVSNLLRLSRIQSDKAIFDIRPCRVQEIIERCLINYDVQAQAKEIRLLKEIQDSLPEVNADSEKISWVLNNLISNSLRHTSAGDEIKVGAYMKDEKMYIFVTDDGEGIPAEFINKIFEKFVQVKEQNSKFVTVGLGLSISKEIVEAHGGEIWCDSKENQGSTFTFTLQTVKSEREED